MAVAYAAIKEVLIRQVLIPSRCGILGKSRRPRRGDAEDGGSRNRCEGSLSIIALSDQYLLKKWAFLLTKYPCAYRKLQRLLKITGVHSMPLPALRKNIPNEALALSLTHDHTLGASVPNVLSNSYSGTAPRWRLGVDISSLS